MPQRLFKQLNNLQSVKPDLNWQSQLRNSLVTRARIDTIDKQLTFTDHLSLLGMIFYKKYFPSPYKMASALVILLIISGTSIMAQAEYVPSRPLYSVKRGFENVEFVFAVTAEQETQLHLKHAKKRQDEAVKIAADVSNPAQKAENLNRIIKSMEQNIVAVKSGLEIAKDAAIADSTDNQKTVALAKEITESTNIAIQALDQVQSSAPNTATKTVNEARSLAEDTNSISLKFLVDNTNQNIGSEEESSVAAQEVKDFISQKLERSEEKIKQVQTITGNAVNTSVNGKNNVNLQDAVQKTTEAQAIVKEAKNLLNNNDLPQALDKIEKASNITKESTGALNKIIEITDGVFGTSSNEVKPTTTIPQIEPENINQVILNYNSMGVQANQTATYTEQIDLNQ